jgi:hypothetical protein
METKRLETLHQLHYENWTPRVVKTYRLFHASLVRCMAASPIVNLFPAYSRKRKPICRAQQSLMRDKDQQYSI